MNAPNLSRRLASRFVETLKGRGRILVVKGGTAALVRTLDDAIAGLVEPIAKSIALVGDPSCSRSLDGLASRATAALLASEHLEDVFADRASVEREIADAARSTIREACAERDESVVTVELDLLGYVAKTAAQRADPETIAEALIEAGRANGAELGLYNAATRQAMFQTTPPIHPDLPLELEETIADELCALVQTGKVDLPTLERSARLGREVLSWDSAHLGRGIDRIANRTLRRTGNAAQWEILEGQRIRVVFTPLSEQDARDIDFHVEAFVREIDAFLVDMAEKIPKAAPMVEKVENVAPPIELQAETPVVVEAKRVVRAKKATKKTEPLKKAPSSPEKAPARKTPRTAKRASSKG